MGLIKTFFKTTNAILDLGSLGIHGYVLGRKYAWDKIKDQSVTKQVAISAKNLFSEVKGYSDSSISPQIFDWLEGADNVSCHGSFKPNWTNLNNKIADQTHNNMSIAAGIGLGMLVLIPHDNILGVVKHCPLAVPLAAIVDRDASVKNDSHLAKLALGIMALDIGYYLTSDSDCVHPELC